MAREENLIPQAHKLTVEQQSKGGKKSAENKRTNGNVVKSTTYRRKS